MTVPRRNYREFKLYITYPDKSESIMSWTAADAETAIREVRELAKIIGSESSNYELVDAQGHTLWATLNRVPEDSGLEEHW